jgi:hypothetical protein
VSPDFFDELVGDEDATPEAVAGLRRVHELLRSASPPPALPARLDRPPRIPRRAPRLPRPRLRIAIAGVAAAGVAGAFAVGYSIGHGGGGFPTSFTRPMHGVGALADARALIWVGKRDPSGNWPLEMSVRGLPTLPHGAWYDLYLTKRGEPDVLCGTFRTESGALTRVRLNAPSELGEYTGWIVTADSPGERDRVLLTT